MEDILKRLLDAELNAQKLVDEADAERERLVRLALADAKSAETRFVERIPEMQAAFVDKAEERAAQRVGELERRYGERRQAMREAAQRNRARALAAALDRLLDTGS